MGTNLNLNNDDICGPRILIKLEEAEDCKWKLKLYRPTVSAILAIYILAIYILAIIANLHLEKAVNNI